MSTPPEIQYFDLPNFTFQDGSSLPLVKLAYRIFNPTASKTALIPTCFRGRINTTLTFTKGALKTHRVIVIALFGNGESSSPSNTPDFPKSLDYRDCVHAQYKLLTQALGISHLDAVLGFSMGGQCTYYWTLLYPDLVRNAVIICSSARTSLHNRQFLEGPKAALEHSVDYLDGGYVGKGVKPLRGLRAFGKAYSAWLTSAAWFEERLFEKIGYATLEEWDCAATGTNYYDWDPEDLLAMLGMWQAGDVTALVPPGTALEEALGSIRARVLLMPCRTDQYFLWEASERECRSLKDGRVHVIPSVWGHLAGGGANPDDVKWMDTRITEFLDSV